MKTPLSFALTALLTTTLFGCGDSRPPAPRESVSHETRMERGDEPIAVAPQAEAPPPAQPAEAPPLELTSESPLRLRLEPAGRHLLATGEALPLRVYALQRDGSERDVTAKATLAVRNPAVGALTATTFIAGDTGSSSTIITATYGGVSATPVLVSVVTPLTHHARGAPMTVAYSGFAGDTLRVSFPLERPTAVTNVEKVRLRYWLSGSADVSLRPVFKTTAHGEAREDAVLLLDRDTAGDTHLDVNPSRLSGTELVTSWALEITLAQTGSIALVLEDVMLVRQFMLGVNMAWMDGQYAHDFGPSWHHPTWGVSYAPEHLHAMLRLLQQLNVRLVRVWVFEGCEGLEKDADERVTGVHQTLWRNYDDFVFNILPQYDIKAYFMLMGARHTHQCSSPSPFTDLAAKRAMLDNALLPFVSRYAASPWVIGFDLMNEPEGAIAGGDGNYEHGVSWQVMRSFLAEAALAVRTAAPGALVSAGSGWHDEDNVAAGRFSGLGFTHLDFHRYDDTGGLPSWASLQRHARVIVGEAGQLTQSRDEAMQARAVGTMLRKAYSGGYLGLWPWAMEHPGATNEHALLKLGSTYANLQPTDALRALRDFSLQHGDVGP